MFRRSIFCRAAVLAPALTLLTLSLFLHASAALATDYTVTRFDDPAPDGCMPADCSLREAVIAANGDTTADRIFLSAGFYSLTIAGTSEDLAATGDLDIFEDLEIHGAEDGLSVIDGTGKDRIIEVTESTTDVTFYRLLLFGGMETNGASVSISRATVTLEDCEVTGNTVVGTGSVVYTALFGTLHLVRSAVVDNTGVGVSVTQATAMIENSTLADNETNGLTTGQLRALGDASVEVVHGTISGPDAVEANDGSITFANSVVDGSCDIFGVGTVTSLGGNYEAPTATCNFTGTGDVEAGFTVALEALDDWGGPTRTKPPVSESPQIDNGLAMHCLATDQRGVPRPLDGDDSGTAECDRGAVEIIPVLFEDTFEDGTTDAWDATFG